MKKTVILIILAVITILCIIFGTYRNANHSFKNHGISFLCFNDDNYNYSEKSSNLDDFKAIDIDADVLSITIKQGDNFFIKCNANKESLLPEYSVSNGKLIVTQSFKSKIGRNECEIELTIPRFTQFDELSISIRVGEIELHDFDCTNMQIENNVGEIEISRINFNTLNAKSNVGEINIKTLTPIEEYFVETKTNIGEINATKVNQDRNSPKKIYVETNIGKITVQ